MEGEPVYDESSGLSKLVFVTLLLMLVKLSVGAVVVLSVPEYDMYILDNLCSPGWEKDLTISVFSLDRQHGFNVSISPESLPSSFWLWRKFGFKTFSLGMSLEPEATGEVIGRIVGTPVEQICIASIPPLDKDRRAPIKWILGRNVVAVMKGIVTESSAGDVSELIKAVVDSEIKSFEVANGVRESIPNWLISLLLSSPSVSLSLSAKAAYLFDVLYFNILSCLRL
jgi:hypothetical protein